MADEERLLRRIIHSVTWIVLVYYLIPDPLFGRPKRLWLMILVGIVLTFEALRLYFRFDVYGIRQYEKRQIAAYAWAAMAAGITLLFFPMHLAIVCLVGMGIVDPVIGEIHYHVPKLYPYVPLVIWFGLALLLLNLFTDISMLLVFVMSVIGSVVAIIAEYPSIIIDDDFLIVVAPLLVLRGIELIMM